MKLRDVVLLAQVALVACGDDGEPAAVGESSSSTSGDETTTAATSATSESTTAADESSSSSTTGAPVVPLGPWTIVSFNLMCSGCTPDGFEPWDARVPHIGDTLRRHDPDIAGIQELFSGEEVALIEAELPEHASIWWAAPDENSLDYADAAIFYRTSMFEPLEQGFYWLSPKPDTPYSTGFAPPQLPRLVVWARFRAIAEDAELVFATTHFDNNSPSQEMSAPLVLERTASMGAELPVIMVGDYNSQPADPAYLVLTGGVDGMPPRFDDAFVLAGDWTSTTNLDPAPSYIPEDRIDHIFTTGGPWQAENWVVDQWGYGPNDMYTSDHFAIAVRLWIP